MSETFQHQLLQVVTYPEKSVQLTPSWFKGRTVKIKKLPTFVNICFVAIVTSDFVQFIFVQSSVHLLVLVVSVGFEVVTKLMDQLFG